jgi:hypothetical protein
MAENKTKETDKSVEAFLKSVENEKRRQDSFAVLNLMKEVTGLEPRMWGDAIVGFGNYHYKYESGREGDMPLVGFSPRKQNLTLYLVMGGFDQYDALMNKLGKFKTSKACLYLNKLEDVDLNVLRELVKQSVEYMKNKK